MTARYARLVALAAVASAAACGDRASAPTTPKTIVRPILVDSVEVVLAPPSAHVRGIIGDGCTELGSVRMQRAESTVSITIFSERPQDAICSQIAKLYDATLALPGDFPSGPYVLRVNGVEKTFTIP